MTEVEGGGTASGCPMAESGCGVDGGHAPPLIQHLPAARRASRVVYANCRMSTKCPCTAAAAAMAGLTKWVRPPLPLRPSKLRLLVDAQRSPGSRRSAFIARHMLQPGSRHSKPAALKITSRPSRSACSFTKPEPGTTSASLTFLATYWPSFLTTAAASRMSSMRLLVHEPMKILSTKMSFSALPGSRFM